MFPIRHYTDALRSELVAARSRREDARRLLPPAEALSALTSANPFLTRMSSWSNVIAAGGSLARAIVGGGYRQGPTDVDLFLHSVEREDHLNATVQRIVSDMRPAWVYRTEAVITLGIEMESAMHLCQIAMIKCDNVIDLLEAFDVDESCIMFDGTSFFLHRRAMDAFSSAQSHIRPSLANRKVFSRLLKYAAFTGHRIVLPRNVATAIDMATVGVTTELMHIRGAKLFATKSVAAQPSCDGRYLSMVRDLASWEVARKTVMRMQELRVASGTPLSSVFCQLPCSVLRAVGGFVGRWETVVLTAEDDPETYSSPYGTPSDVVALLQNPAPTSLYVALMPFLYRNNATFTWADDSGIGRAVRDLIHLGDAFFPTMPLTRTEARVFKNYLDQPHGTVFCPTHLPRLPSIRDKLWRRPLRLRSIKALFCLHDY